MNFFPLIAGLALLLSCTKRDVPADNYWQTFGSIQALPHTQTIDLASFQQVVYVSRSVSDINADGSKEKPFASLSVALQSLPELSSENRAAVLVSTGIYSDESLILREFVHLLGGYDSSFKERDIRAYPTRIMGNGERRLLIAANQARIDGFILSDAVFRSKGAAIYCDGTSPEITNNIFENNRTLKPIPWDPKYLHETAHDGGAIYGKDGAAPLIKNNLFINNQTENGRGAAIAMDGYCEPIIRNNTFYKNMSGSDDPMRSSDGGAISLFRWSKGSIEENIFLSNMAGSTNDGGALFVALWSAPVIRNNIFVDNECGDDAGALFVGGQEHRYDAPLDPYPPAQEYNVIIDHNVFIGNRNPAMNSGSMRFTMESRGQFSNNIVAHNNGLYFQRSETQITGNIILDILRIIETKETLGKTSVKNNVIGDNVIWSETRAEFSSNYFAKIVNIPGKHLTFPVFIDDSIELLIVSANYYRAEKISHLLIASSDRINLQELRNRIVHSENKWSVIKDAGPNHLELWGDFRGITKLRVLPTYTPKVKIN